jgi:signal transduction histidine kinase
MSLPAILLVDDRPDNLMALTATLDSLPVEIVAVSSGQAALDAAEAREFALILLDLMMPGIDGVETATRIKAIPLSAHTPILFVTSVADIPAHSLKAYRAGAVDFVQKPYDPAILRSKVAVFIELYTRGRKLQEQEEQRIREHAAREQAEQQRADLEQLAADLQRALAAKDEFLSIASHELRTPLTPLILQLQTLEAALLEAGLEDDKISRKIAIMNRQARRLTRLVEALLDVSRISRGVLALSLEQFDLAELVSDNVALLQPEAVRSGSSIEVVEGAGPVVGVWDPVRIEQLLLNLLSNSLRYGAGRPISIALEATAQEVNLCIKDQGIGIAAQDLERIFHRFERASSTNYGGLGVGLYVARAVVEAHGGSIDVTSALGEGTRFMVRLPRQTAAPEAGAPPA